jgi:hypothetical protein
MSCVQITVCAPPAGGGSGGGGAKYVYLGPNIGSSDFFSAFPAVFEDDAALTLLQMEGTSFVSLMADNCASLVCARGATNSSLAEMTFNDCPALTEVVFNEHIGLTEFTATDCATLGAIGASDCALTTVTIDAVPDLLFLYMNGNAIAEASVNGILVELDAGGLSNGEVDVAGGTSAAPTGAGATAATSLTGKGWTVSTN